MIIRVPGGAAGESGSKSSGTGVFTRLVKGWIKLVPWPFTAIAGGCILALLSLLMQQANMMGAMLLFVVSAVVILAGLLGLFIQVKKEPQNQPLRPEEQARTLNVYKRHECAITRELAEKFAEVEKALAEGMMGQGLPVDWEAHARISAGARESPAEYHDVPRVQGALRIAALLGRGLPQVPPQTGIVPAKLEEPRDSQRPTDGGVVIPRWVPPTLSHRGRVH